VVTAPAHGWAGISNGKLLALAESEFDVFVTVDRNLSLQQHLPKYNIAVVLLVATSNRIDELVELVPALLKALASAPKGAVTKISL
jgi:hypothetical protein